MSNPTKKFSHAIKHGGYARTILFPGEDAAAYKKLPDKVFAEFAPAGPAEEDIVIEIADLLWRKQNLGIFHMAQLAKRQYSAFFDHCGPALMTMPLLGYEKETRSPEEIRTLREAAEERAREELSEIALQMVDMGTEITVEHYIEELTRLDRINGYIDRCIKRLLLVRGAKSMSLSTPPAVTPSRK
jgi:hypothetical protein